ncbi:hypothetical protein J6TS1_20050 [Siminovitchia terrae]|uniref:Uncharacterized protein n=1 Tax=Siminovitchia terrae TaxID=1914933 RepID=A0ABQ4KXA0_SIMTE|nr:hypothetical protein J6TS1_20050 [Siminovitchia terrae]
MDKEHINKNKNIFQIEMSIYYQQSKNVYNYFHELTNNNKYECLIDHLSNHFHFGLNSKNNIDTISTNVFITFIKNNKTIARKKKII